MGERLRSRGVSWILLGAAAIAVLTSVFTSAAVGSGSVVGGKAATVHSNAPANSISATVYVSAIYCGGTAQGQYAGQRAGVQLLGRYSASGVTIHPFDFSGYYSYCQGHRAVYTPEFILSDPRTGLLRFIPVGFRISPGDPLRVRVTRGPAGVTVWIYDVNTRRTRSLTVPPLGPNGGWSAGALALYGDTSGKPFLTGYEPLDQPYSPTGGPLEVPGPVPWAPIVFTELRGNGHTVGHGTKGVYLTTWLVLAGPASAASAAPRVEATAAGTTPTNATVTPPSNGSFESTDGGLPPPTLGQNVDLTRVSGSVLVQVPGAHKFKKVRIGVQVPNGSRIDAPQGSAQMTLALPHGNFETGVFYDGQFKLHQNGKSGATVATLTGGKPAGCATPRIQNPAVGEAAGASTVIGAHAGSSSAVASAAKAKNKPKKVRSLWANAHGNFTTKGSGGAAAVLGTKWYTEDTCTGTWFRVVRDKIKVTAYYPQPHEVIVTAGHSFFAPNQSSVPIIEVSPVTTTGGHYNVRVTDTYRLTVISDGHPSYVDAAVAPQLPSGGTTALFPDGSVNGTPRWYVLFNITPNLIHFQYWNVGVQIGQATYVVRLRVSG